MREKTSHLRLKADISKLNQVLLFLEKELREGLCPEKVITQICIAVEEVFVNIANYAYANPEGECFLNLSVETDKMTLIIADSGAKFNPLEKEDPDITLSVQERKIGGLGIWMVKQSMDLVTYEYKEGQNQLTLVRTWT